MLTLIVLLILFIPYWSGFMLALKLHFQVKRHMVSSHQKSNQRVCWSSHWHWPLRTWIHSREEGDDDFELHVWTPEVGGLILTTDTNFWIPGCNLEYHCELSAPGVRSFVRLCYVGSNMQFLFALAMLLFYIAWILHQKQLPSDLYQSQDRHLLKCKIVRE